MKLPWSKKSQRTPMVFDHPDFQKLSLKEAMDFYEGVVPPWILQAMFESMYFNYLKMMNLFGEDEFNDMLDATEEYYTAMERIESGAKESLELRKKVAGLDPAYIAFDEFGRDDKLPQ